MNTKTIWFRGALSLAVLWLTVVGSWSYISYSNEYMPMEGLWYSIPREEIEECDYAPGLSTIYRDPTHEERKSCRNRKYDEWRSLTESSNEFNRNKSIKHFAYYGGIPSALLLFIAALWSNLALGARYIARRYIDWLRGNPPTA